MSAAAAFCYRQWGGTWKYLNGRELDGRTYDAMPTAAEHPASGLLELRLSVASRDWTSSSRGSKGP